MLPVFPVGATTVCSLYSILFLKLWSYVQVNLWCRHKLHSSGKPQLRRQSLSAKSNLSEYFTNSLFYKMENVVCQVYNSTIHKGHFSCSFTINLTEIVYSAYWCQHHVSRRSGVESKSKSQTYVRVYKFTSSYVDRIKDGNQS